MSCGSGSRNRTRSCLSVDTNDMCPGPNVETTSCSLSVSKAEQKCNYLSLAGIWSNNASININVFNFSNLFIHFFYLFASSTVYA